MFFFIVFFLQYFDLVFDLFVHLYIFMLSLHVCSFAMKHKTVSSQFIVIFAVKKLITFTTWN